MNRHNWYWILLFVAVLLIYTNICVSIPESEKDRFRQSSAIIFDIIQYDECF